MRLGFVLFDYFPFGGLQRNCLSIAEACAERGHEVVIFTRTWQGPRPTGIQVASLGRRGLTNLSRNRNFLEGFREAIADFAIDVVVGFNKMPGLDVCYVADPCFLAKAKRLKGRWYRWTPRFWHFQRLEAAVFAKGVGTEIMLLTDQERGLYEDYYATEPERFHLLPPGIPRHEETDSDRDRIRRDCREAMGWADDEQVLLFVGSGFRTKGLDRAIRGLASMPCRCRLVVVGNQKPGRFEFLARRLGVQERVEFLGGRDDVYKLMVSGDLLVHPAYSENTGTVLVEALTAGLPVLTTDVCGFATHIEAAEAGDVVGTPFDQEDFNDRLRKMLVSSERLRDWRRNGLRYAATQDLYSRRERAVEVIESTAMEKVSRG